MRWIEEGVVKISSVLGNSQKLDGGAMFGNAPKPLWARWAEADALNRIPLACRGLLVETDDRRILFEAGIGVYMEPRLADRFGVQENHHVLLASLEGLGLSHEAITDVVLSHLHFDHVGGLLSAWDEGKPSQLLFPHARFYVSQSAFERAMNPHLRDRASFIPHLNQQLKQSGRLQLIQGDERLVFGDLSVSFKVSHGHTPGMLCSVLSWEDQRLVFGADLVPGVPWVHLPITMGYDRFPEKLIDEKQALLSDLADHGGTLFFTHDPEVACAAISWNERQTRFFAENTRAELRRAAFNEIS